MRKLGEQWVEELDGKKHMLKAVNYSDGCNGCIFLRYDPDEFYTCNRGRLGCPVDDGMIIKDLGILNEEGLLPCPFCGEYPMLFENENVEEKIVHGVAHYAFTHEIVMTDEKDTDDVRHWFYTEQEAIDAWNRRT